MVALLRGRVPPQRRSGQSPGERSVGIRLDLIPVPAPVRGNCFGASPFTDARTNLLNEQISAEKQLELRTALLTSELVESRIPPPMQLKWIGARYHLYLWLLACRQLIQTLHHLVQLLLQQFGILSQPARFVLFVLPLN